MDTRISLKSCGDAIREFLKRNKYQPYALDCLCNDCFTEHVKNGCRYGQADGPDDFCKDCECGE